MANETIILACGTLKQELEYVMDKTSCKYPVELVDSGLHAWPDKLRDSINGKLGQLDEKYSTVLLIFGFCGNSLVGVNSGKRTLVMPLVADCIPIFLGSNEERDKAGIDTYFFTEGYLNHEQTIVSEYERSLEKYGKKRADRIAKILMQHYRKLAVIDTGVFRVEHVQNRIKGLSESLGIPSIILQGNLRLIEDLLKGNWDQGDFLIVQPNSTISLESSFRVGCVGEEC